MHSALVKVLHAGNDGEKVALPGDGAVVAGVNTQAFVSHVQQIYISQGGFVVMFPHPPATWGTSIQIVGAGVGEIEAWHAALLHVPALTVQPVYELHNPVETEAQPEDGNSQCPVGEFVGALDNSEATHFLFTTHLPFFQVQASDE